MPVPSRSLTVSSAEDRALRRAVEILEGQSFVGRMTELTGQPITQLLRRLPAPVTHQINRTVRRTLAGALDVALRRMEPGRQWEPGPGMFQLASSITGGVSGLFGIGALAIELPVTTSLMLRSIAGIALSHGEQLHQPMARMACLEVFALGANNRNGVTGDTSYFAARAVLAKTVSQAAQAALERSVAGASVPVIVDLVSAIGSRFGVVVSERAAASAVPVVGAIGGAAVNLVFMKHFQQLAWAHFVVRRLERRHGSDWVRLRYRLHDEARNHS